MPGKPPGEPLRDSLFLKKEIGNEAYFRIPLDQITYLQSNRSYCIIHLHDGSAHLESHPLKQVFEEILAKKHQNKFVRVHKSYAINTDYICAYEGNCIRLTGDIDIPVGQTYREQVRQLFS
jgi:DNA-binding LytR/AlgR family response regulator